MGWDGERLMTLFTTPMFMATHRIYRQKGEDYVRALIQRVSASGERLPARRDGLPHRRL